MVLVFREIDPAATTEDEPVGGIDSFNCLACSSPAVPPLNTNVVFSAVAAAEERPPLCPVDETSRVLKYFDIFG
jgi:hypothetical protein